MKINQLGSFAAGILLSTAIIGGVYFLTDEKADGTKEADNEAVVEKPTEDELKSELESLGYVVQTQEEYDKKLAEAAQSTEKEQAEKEKADENAETEKTVTRVVINVSNGMTSIDVGRALEEAKLIDKDAFSFSKDIEARGLENKLKPGSYAVDSNMSYDEIISAIFK